MHGQRRRLDDILPAALAGFAALLLYGWTASPWVSHEDIAQFQALSGAPGIAHAGYPLLTLLLELAHRLPFGSIAYRANLVSAVCGALAVGIGVFSMIRFTGSRPAAVVAGIALALSYSLWHDSTRAEVYALTLALSAGAFVALAAHAESPRPRALFAAFLLIGLGFTCHLSVLGIAAVAAAYLLARLLRREASWRNVAFAALGFAIGLTPFFVTLARDVPGAPMNYLDYTLGHQIPWADDLGTRLRRLALLISGRQFLDSAGFNPFQDLVPRLKLLALNVVLNDLNSVGALAAAAGIALAARRRAKRDLLLLAWLASVLFWLGFGAYAVVLSSFFLPGLWILAHFAALALARLERRRVAFAVAAGLMLALAALRPAIAKAPLGLEARPMVSLVWRQWPAGWSPFVHDRSWDRYGREVLAAAEPRAVILFCWNEGTVLLYFRHAVGLRPDVTLRPACKNAALLEAIVAEARAEGRPVYATIPDGERFGNHTWEPAGRWPGGGLWKLRE